MTSWAGTNFYAVLCVGRQATSSDIRDAYRRLALERHPDKNPGDPGAVAAFQKLQEAYDVLYDERKRRNYDSSYTFSQQHFTNTARTTPTHGESTSEAAERLRAEKREKEWAEQAQSRASNIAQLAKDVSNLSAALFELDLTEAERRAEDYSSKGFLGYISSLWSAKQVKTEEEIRRRKLEHAQQRLVTNIKLERARVRLREAEQDHRNTLQQQDQVKREEAGQRARRRAAEQAEDARARRATMERAREEARQRQQQEARRKREQEEKERRERDLRQELLDRLAKQSQPGPTTSPTPETANNEDDSGNQHNRGRRQNTTPTGQANVCRHKKFWPKVNGRHDCSICRKTLNGFVLQCPNCNIMACASCKKSLKI